MPPNPGIKSEAIEHAKTLWRYLSSMRSRKTSDAIIVCCSYDLRVGEHACKLFHDQLAPIMLISGLKGNWTNQLWDDPEFEVFKRLVISLGVPEQKIYLEEHSTNFGENIAFSKSQLPLIKSAIFVTKPNSVLRLSLTASKVWAELDYSVDSPIYDFPEEVSNVVGLLGLIDEMVGDIQRIQIYPRFGYQIPHSIPDDVLSAWRSLIEHGFTGHLIQP